MIQTWVALPLSPPREVPSQNEIERQGHAPGGHHRVTRWKNEWQEAAFWAWKQHRTTDRFAMLTSRPCDVKLDLRFRNNRKRDPHNYVSTVTKWAIDGLVKAGAWPDDNPDYLTVHEPVLTVHKGLSLTQALPCFVLLSPRSHN